MTKEELVKIFCDKMHDELHDIEEDAKLHRELEEAGMTREAEMIEAIAKEEYTHAKGYRTMLARHGHKLSDEAVALWEKVEELFEWS